MQAQELQSEISNLESQIEHQEKLFDIALKNDLELGQAKRIFHEVRLLREKLDALIKQKFDTNM